MEQVQTSAWRRAASASAFPSTSLFSPRYWVLVVSASRTIPYSPKGVDN